MASGPLQQIPSTAVDAAGLSVSTSLKSATDSRPGHVWNPLNFAAAVPVYFQPTTNTSLGGQDFLMLSSQRWTAATVAADNPGAYTAYTADTTPNWVLVNAASGLVTAINSGLDIPMKTTNDARTLTGAASRGVDMLWTLNSVTQGSDTVAVVQHFNINMVINTVILRGEETIPVGTHDSDTIVFCAGIQLNSTTTPYLYVYGTDSSHQVYAARKAWARVGYVGTSTSPLDSQWEFGNGTGWTTDSTALQPIQTVSGPLTSLGPLSFANYTMHRAQRGMRNAPTGYSFVSAVAGSGSARSAQIYSSLGGRPWQPSGAPIALGTSGTTYLGGTLQLQGHVGPNPAMINASTSATAIPYVSSVLSTSGGDSSIVQNWGLLQVPRHF